MERMKEHSLPASMSRARCVCRGARAGPFHPFHPLNPFKTIVIDAATRTVRLAGRFRGPPRSYFFVKSPAFTIVIFDGSMYFRIASTSCCGVRAAIRFSSSMSYAIVRSR